MKKAVHFLSSIEIRNFKAIYDSKAIRLTPLTVLIGNNGSGKSSIIEGLETVETLVSENLDAALQLWRGIEHVRNKTRKVRQLSDRSSKCIEFKLRGSIDRRPFTAIVAINEKGGGNEVFFQNEYFECRKQIWERNNGKIRHITKEESGINEIYEIAPEVSLLQTNLSNYTCDWQFLRLNPQQIGNPHSQIRTVRKVHLAKDGGNLAEYLLDIRKKDLAAFEGIIETLKYVLPYAADVQPALTTELERTAYVQMSEKDFKVPGWLLSSGTLRILALLAIFRHPSPPPLIVIEEIENGLDPRTVNLVVDEINNLVQQGRSQVIITTHSPYLLDLIPLSSVVFVERDDGGDPIFSRPADTSDKQEWAKKFATGQLYTMDRLSKKVTK